MQVSKRGVPEESKKHWMKGVFLVFLWLLIISMVRDFWQTKRGFTRIDETERRLQLTRLKNVELVEKLRIVSTEDYKDRLVREKLNMQRDGEIVVIMPSSGTKTMGLDLKVKELKNWQKWLEVLGFNPSTL